VQLKRTLALKGKKCQGGKGYKDRMTSLMMWCWWQWKTSSFDCWKVWKATLPERLVSTNCQECIGNWRTVEGVAGLLKGKWRAKTEMPF
jgi:hypothetical protein